MGKIMAVCVSEQKGVQKKDIHSALLNEDWGIDGDAHGGKWKRQISLLSHEKIEAFRAKGAKVGHGAFGENLVVEGIDFAALPIGTQFQCNGTLLELSQKGKECHHRCAIFHQIGDCIMPTQGVFARVLKGGVVTVGDDIAILPAQLRAAVITASDSGFVGAREDLSTGVALELLKEAGYRITSTTVLPDDRKLLAKELTRLCDEEYADLIVTTGGTGFSATDCVPEATLDVVERLAPGIGEAMRIHSLAITPRAMLSRATAGIRKKSLIVNLPGSPKAVRECLSFILPSLEHGIGILRGTEHNCAK